MKKWIALLSILFLIIGIGETNTPREYASGYSVEKVNTEIEHENLIEKHNDLIEKFNDFLAMYDRNIDNTYLDLGISDENVTIQKIYQDITQEITKVEKKTVNESGYLGNSIRVNTDGLWLNGTVIKADGTIHTGEGNYSNSDTPFFVDYDGRMSLKDQLTFDGTNLSITGAISAASGDIGGWNIWTSSLTSTTNNMKLDSLNEKIDVGTIEIDGANERIRNTAYVSGHFGQGFSISPDLIEANNAIFRGVIRAGSFEAGSLATLGGSFIVANADTLDENMTVYDTSTLRITGDVTFSLNDILRIKHSTDDEWLIVAGTTSAPTYSVTRDTDTQYGADNNPAWTKGTSVVSYGQSGDGLVYMTATDSNSPYLSIFTHTGQPWNTITNRVQIGNLASVSSDSFGTLSGYGLWTDKGYFEGEIYGSTVTAGIVRTSSDTTQARIILNDDGIISYNSDENEVFNSSIFGTTEGDVTIGEYSNGYGVKWDNSEKTLDIQGLSIFGDMITYFSWNLTTASYDSVFFDVSSEDIAPEGVHFNTDGSRMYVVGYINDKVFQYILSTPWDVSTSSYNNVNISVPDTFPTDLHFKPDGSKMYVMGYGSDRVYQYTLTIPWDLSTASYDSVLFSVSSEDGGPTGLHFNTDGSKMYMSGWSNNKVFQYILSTPWDVSTSSYNNVNLDVSSEDGATSGLFFNGNGSKMYVMGWENDRVSQYTLTIPWDLSTASYDSVFFSIAEETNSVGLFFKLDGSKMYILGWETDKVYQYTTTGIGLFVDNDEQKIGIGTSTPTATLEVNGDLTVVTGSTFTVGYIDAEQSIKGWINFDGTGVVAINDSYNVTSITDNGVGNYTITWDANFAGTNYVCVGMSGTNHTMLQTVAPLAAGTTLIFTLDNAENLVDEEFITVLAIGDR